MTVQWINEPCPGPGGIPPGWSAAEAWYGAGVIPPTTRPPWLHDSGGVGPGIIAGLPGELGQPAGETWQFRFYDAEGYLVFAMPGYRALTYAQGVETLRQAYLNSSATRGVAKVCAVVRSQYGGARLCHTSYGMRTESNSPTWTGTPGCRPGAALRADGWCVFKVPMQPLMGPYGFVGQTCDQIQAHINDLQNARNQLSQDLVTANNGYNAAVKAYSALVAAGQDATGAGDAVNAANAQVADIKTNINNVDAELVKSKAELAACQAAAAQPQPQPGCTDDFDCDPGFMCVNGNCVSGCLTDARCPTGQKCVNGQCVPPVSKAGAGAGGWALALLALAAVGAIFFRGAPGGMRELEELE